ncbi:hypothetical protein [Pararhizobium sp.]|uniref:hypothetical protein n=1 Tax=Pararhizobium sp. TaxID=1977563 RepID=UPI002722A2F9|nr:hypothetical protein [Pararhizobium sp.]MDO9415092.1 hypothetical protein [Pararhizobium sp.]
MADFVAVIRRAVDGLSDNTPEMRVKVYEKARGAVRRQLESMKPRPSDVMFDRQLGKLESAITEVEAEHAEALPAEGAGEIAAVAAQTVEHEAPPEERAEAPAERAHAEEHPADEAVAEERAEEPAAVAEPEDAEKHEPEHDLIANEPAQEAPTVEPEAEPEALAAGYEEQVKEEPPAEDDHVDSWLERERGHAASDEPAGAQQAAHPADEPEEQPATDEHRPFARYPGNEGLEVDPVLLQEPAAEPVQQPAVWDLTEWTSRTQAAEEEAAVASHDLFRDEQPVLDAADEADRAGQTGAESWSWNNDDPFQKSADAGDPLNVPPAEASNWAWPVEKQAESASDTGQKPGAWNELEELIGYDGKRGAAANTAADVDALPSVPERSYSTERSRSRTNFLPLLLALVVLGLLAGGGYAYWQNQDTVKTWVAGLMTSILPADEAPVETDAKTTTPTTDTAKPQDEAAVTPTTETAAQPEVAAFDGSSKFTQRLQTDGTESDPGPAEQRGADGTAEGTTVAAQTDAGSRQADTAAAAAATAAAVEGGDPTVETSGQTEQAQQNATAQAPVGVSQKMFLYEEKLGQTAPVAVEGTVVWSVKEESPGGDAKPEPAIQGQITVPDRGVTALMTIKRNADASLPASHIIEFVFSLPESFEGGGIENVQRVAMKQTEQDRGDALIAVPAKVTDDFHMIALNDFPEAVTRNLELLRSRDWIDIPLTYRNGRRALITMEKGSTGVEAFNTVMRNWAALTKPVATSQ